MTDHELDPEQMRRLTNMRHEHHKRLVESGTARRILDAAAPMNYWAETSTITEGTLFYPSRERIGQMAVGRLWGTEFSLAANIASHATELESLLFNESSDVIYMRRFDAEERGGYTVSGGATGIQVERGNSQGRLIPLDLIEDRDHRVVVEVLGEVQERYEAGEFPCLDPETLVNTTLSRPGPIPMP